MAWTWADLALSQRTYPGVGDIDDCWVVATIYAIRRMLRQGGNLPTVPEYRAAAGDPDNGYKDGGTLDEIERGARRLYPHVKFVRFARNYAWAAFEAYLNQGYTASIALRSSYLPSTYRYGFLNTHQVSVFKKSGVWYIVNPLQGEGTSPRPITEAALQRAVYAFAGGWIMALLVPPVNTGEFRITKGLPHAYRVWWRTTSGGWASKTRYTSAGFTSRCNAPVTLSVGGKDRKMCFITSEANAGLYIELVGDRRKFLDT